MWWFDEERLLASNVDHDDDPNDHQSCSSQQGRHRELISCDCFGLYSLVPSCCGGDSTLMTMTLTSYDELDECNNREQHTCGVDGTTTTTTTATTTTSKHPIAGRSTTHCWEPVFCRGEDFPSPRSGHTLAMHPSQPTAVLFGGLGGGLSAASTTMITYTNNLPELFNDLWFLFLDKMEWVLYPVVNNIPPTPRYGHTANLTSDGKLHVVIGGLGSANALAAPHETELGDVSIFNMHIGSWETDVRVVGDSVTPRWGHSSFTYVERNSRDDASCSTASPFRSSHVVLDDAQEYVVCLLGESALGHGAGVSWLCVETREWRDDVPTIGERPPPRRRHQSTLHGDTVIIFGGRSNKTFRNDTWSLDIQTWTYRKIEASVGVGRGVPTPRTGHTMVQVGSLVYSFGGFAILDDPAATTIVLHNDVHVLDTAGGTWRRVTPSRPHPRASCTRVQLWHARNRLPPQASMSAAFVYNGRVYIHGGRGNNHAYGIFMCMPLEGDYTVGTGQCPAEAKSLRYFVMQYMADHGLVKSSVPPHLREIVDSKVTFSSVV